MGAPLIEIPDYHGPCRQIIVMRGNQTVCGICDKPLRGDAHWIADGKTAALVCGDCDSLESVAVINMATQPKKLVIDPDSGVIQRV